MTIKVILFIIFAILVVLVYGALVVWHHGQKTGNRLTGKAGKRGGP